MMSSSSINLTDQVYEYYLSVTLREDEVMRRCREETAGHKWAGMQISPEQGQFMTLLVKLLGARKIIELGVFTGYSSLCMARALPPEGRLVACDVKKEYTDKAMEYWKAAGVADRVELRLAPALDTLADLLRAGEEGSFDFIFVDAIKEEYSEYYPLNYRLLRSGGLMAIDNVLWGGSVADPDNQKAETNAIRAFNKMVHEDDRVDMCMLPVGDGLSLIRKR